MDRRAGWEIEGDVGSNVVENSKEKKKMREQVRAIQVKHERKGAKAGLNKIESACVRASASLDPIVRARARAGAQVREYSKCMRPRACARVRVRM
eukprot:6201550-Pleurochrysis_carterae.AAC.1